MVTMADLIPSPTPEALSSSFPDPTPRRPPAEMAFFSPPTLDRLIKLVGNNEPPTERSRRKRGGREGGREGEGRRGRDVWDDWWRSSVAGDWVSTQKAVFHPETLHPPPLPPPPLHPHYSAAPPETPHPAFPSRTQPLPSPPDNPTPHLSTPDCGPGLWLAPGSTAQSETGGDSYLSVLRLSTAKPPPAPPHDPASRLNVRRSVHTISCQLS